MDTSLSYRGSGSSMIKLSGSGGGVGVTVLADGHSRKKRLAELLPGSTDNSSDTVSWFASLPVSGYKLKANPTTFWK